MDNRPHIVGIPLGTRLHALVLHGDCVHVWIALKDRHADYARWQGTYLCIEPNGTVTRITQDDNYLVADEHTYVVKGPHR